MRCLILLLSCAFAFAVNAQEKDNIEWIDGALEKGAFVEKHFGLKNVSDKNIEQITVECGFFDSNNNLVSTGFENIFQLAAGDTAYQAVTLPSGGDASVRAKCRWYSH